MPPKKWTEEMKQYIIELKNLRRCVAWEKFLEKFPEMKGNTTIRSFSLWRTRLDAVPSSYESLVWTSEKIQFFKDNINLSKTECWEKFHQKWPEITFYAFSNERVRSGGSKIKIPHEYNRQKDLYHIRCKKDGWQIKVAQPSTWMSLAKWIYLEYNPGAINEVQKTDAFYWADGDPFNRHPDNILLVHRREQPVFMNMGGVVKGDANATRINLLLARKKLAELDLGEKIGIVTTYASGASKARVFTGEFRERCRQKARKAYREHPEAHRETARRCYRKKMADPERKEKYLARRREWWAKNKERINAEKRNKNQNS